MRRKVSWTFISWAFIVACGIVSLVTLAINAHSPAYFDADAASETILANTLIESHDLIATPEFIYSTELQFFSSQLFMEVGIGLFRGNWLAARLVGTFLLMVALVASYRYMAKQVGMWERARWVAGLLILPFSEYYLRFFLFGTYYIPELCAVFLAIGACAHAMRTRTAPKPLLIATGVLGFGFGANGYRTTLLCCIPAILAVCAIKFFGVKGKTLAERARNIVSSSRDELIVPAVLGISSVLGTLFNVTVLSGIYDYLRFGSLDLLPFWASDFMNLLVAGFVGSWGYTGAPDLAGVDGLAALSALLLGFVMFVSTCACLARRRHLDERQQCLCVYLLVTLLMSAAMYYLGNRSEPRYMTLSVVPMIITVPMALSTFEEDVLLRRLVSGVVVGCMVFQSYALWFGPSILHASSGELYLKEQMVAWLEKKGYTQGYATYWNANDIIEISDGRLDVWAMGSSRDADVITTAWLEDPSNFPWLEEKRHAEEEPKGKVFLILRFYETGQVIDAGRSVGEPVATFSGYERTRLYEQDEQDEETVDYAIYEFESADAMHAALTKPVS